MDFDRISGFAHQLDGLSIVQTLRFHPVSGGDDVEYVLDGDRILYGPSLKNFGTVLHRYFTGSMTMSFVPFHHTLPPDSIFIDVRLLLWFTVRESVGEKAVDAVFGEGKLFLRTSVAVAERYRSILSDRLESIMVLYFRARFKPIESFLAAYPQTEKQEFARAVAGMILVGVLSVNRLAPSAAAVPDIADPVSLSKDAVSPEVILKIKGLMRMLNKLNE